MSGIELPSKAFDDHAFIARRYALEGENVSPPLRWEGAPPGVESWALVVEDPDAPAKTWAHWLLYDLPAGTRGLEEGVPPAAELENGARHGRTDFGGPGYGGPSPPPGAPHRYVFRLYALDRVLGAPPGLTRSRLFDEMQGHVLARGQLTGTYARPAGAAGTRTAGKA